MDQQILLLILGLLFILVLVLTVFVGVLSYKLFFKESLSSRPPQESQDSSKPKSEVKKGELVDPTLMMCVNHPERQAQGVCAISQETICETCIREDDGLVISVDHFRTYLEAQWVIIERVKATPDDTTASAHIYRLKNRLWSSEEVPTLVSTHYKIDVETDQIESHIHFLVREEEQDKLQALLEKERQVDTI